jgi:two-component system cell cycle response regulator DivK
MKNVLLTDDDPEMVELIRLVLRNSGYRLTQARDGNEAVEVALRDKPDLVVMDLRMPGKDGITAAAILRERGFTNPIVVLTASESEEDRRRARDAGCNAYILKTLDMNGLERLLDSFLAETGGI